MLGIINCLLGIINGFLFLKLNYYYYYYYYYYHHHHLSIEAILANRLIPLDKGEGVVRPIGVGEVIRRINGKCVMRVTKPDVVDASGSLQVCAGHKSGSKAAIHGMRNNFDADETDAVLVVDVSNAFNGLNRAAALHNTRVLCPTTATYAINTYRPPARLYYRRPRT